VPLVDLAGPDAEAALTQALEAEVHTPCDLTRAPILRARLFRLGEGDHVLALVLHHMVTDGWSNGLIVSELRALYEAAAEGRQAALPVPPRACADPENAAGLDFWTERLAGEPVLDLPTDRPRAARQSFAGRLERQEIPAELRQRLARVGEAQGATLYGVLLAAFQLFLLRLTGSDDVVAGAIAAGRGRDDGADAVGCMVDVLPLRSRPAGEPSFADFVRQVQAELLDAMDHRGVPLGQLAEALGIRRDPARPPLVAAVLNLHRGHAGGFSFGAAGAETIAVHNGGAKFELALTAVETEGALRLEWEYRTALFDAETIRAWGASFHALLEAAAAAPETGIWTLDTLDADERRRVLGAWAGTPRTAPAGPSLAERVAARAAEAPEAVAVRWDAGRMTRAELHARAGRLAARLGELGVRPGTRVALCLERGPEMVVGMLGAVMAGAAYVPVDPDYPDVRIRQVLEDSGAPVVLTQSRFAAALSRGPARVMALDAEWDALAAGPAAEPAAVRPDEVAYVLFTSGSTGRPKGVEVPHGALLNHMEWMEREFRLAGGSVLQKTPFGFDASVWEFWAPLLEGGCLVMARPGGHRDPAYLVDALRGEEITTVQLVPSLLRALVDEPGLERCRALCRVFVGGEALERALVARLRARLDVQVVNLYGPTESCIDTVFHVCTGEGAAPGEPIGLPVDGILVYVLDPRGRPVPACVPGELYLGGAGLARGYVARPALTADRFVPDAFSGDAGARLYRTGDRVRRRADGVLEYLERTDFQVKVRGFRIELGEIEEALRADARVREVAVLARGAGEDAALVAYLACAKPAPSPAELRAALQQRLPEYMVPSAFVMLDRLPLAPNGKLDRAALPEPDAAALAAGQAYTAPETPAEEKVAAIWADVLGIERVGIHDDFFALGGHSLRATRVIARVEERFGVALPLRTLFENPTVATLAAAIDALRPDEDDDELLRLEQILAEIEALPLDLAQEAASAD
jgi:amino acid adenylation domain-containing protein